MIIKNCESCGIAITRDENLLECLKFRRRNSSQNIEDSCIYYIETKFEDGEAMTPHQQLLLKEQELKARKMKGVI